LPLGANDRLTVARPGIEELGRIPPCALSGVRVARRRFSGISSQLPVRDVEAHAAQVRMRKGAGDGGNQAEAQAPLELDGGVARFGYGLSCMAA
jgi:hypothetical protein